MSKQIRLKQQIEEAESREKIRISNKSNWDIFRLKTDSGLFKLMLPDIVGVCVENKKQ